MQDAEEILQEVLQQDLASCGTETQLDLGKFLAAFKMHDDVNLLSAWMKGKEQYRPSLDMVERFATRSDLCQTRCSSGIALARLLLCTLSAASYIV